jgi:hypothetical protein
MMATWLEDISKQMWSVLDAFRDEVREQGVLSLLRPIAPFNQPTFMAPAVTIGAIVACMLLSGVAVGALGTLLLSLLALYLLLVQVFGVSIELMPIGAR